MSKIFWLLRGKNIFTIHHHIQADAYATGGVWAGGSAVLSNYNVGADLPMKSDEKAVSLRVEGLMSIHGGINHAQNSVIGKKNGCVLGYTMTNLNGAPNQPLVQETPAALLKQSICQLYKSTADWATGGHGCHAHVEQNRLILRGDHPKCNLFTINGLDICQSGLGLQDLREIWLYKPPLSAACVSFLGCSLSFVDLALFENNQKGEKENGGQLLWNFPNAKRLYIKGMVYGSLLAPFACVETGEGTIYGTVMVYGLRGKIKAVDTPFRGDLEKAF